MFCFHAPALLSYLITSQQLAVRRTRKQKHVLFHIKHISCINLCITCVVLSQNMVCYITFAAPASTLPTSLLKQFPLITYYIILYHIIVHYSTFVVHLHYMILYVIISYHQQQQQQQQYYYYYYYYHPTAGRVSARSPPPSWRAPTNARARPRAIIDIVIVTVFFSQTPVCL